MQTAGRISRALRSALPLCALVVACTSGQEPSPVDNAPPGEEPQTVTSASTIVLPIAKVRLPRLESREGMFEIGVRIDGTIVVGETVLYDPQHPPAESSHSKLDEWIQGACGQMPRGEETYREDWCSIAEVVNRGALLLRVDRETPIEALMPIFEACLGAWNPAWKFGLLVESADSGAEQAIPMIEPGFYFRFDGLREFIQVQVEVVEPGRRMAADGSGPWSGDANLRYRNGDDRVVLHSLGPRIGTVERMRTRLQEFGRQELDGEERRQRQADGSVRTVSRARRLGRVEARRGVTYGEVVELFEALYEAGYTNAELSLWPLRSDLNPNVSRKVIQARK